MICISYIANNYSVDTNEYKNSEITSELSHLMQYIIARNNRGIHHSIHHHYYVYP